jgi:SAM-dependent methyltransferase
MTPLPAVTAEEELREFLVEHFAPVYGERVCGYVDSLMSIDEVRGRFDYLLSVVGGASSFAGKTAMISGFGVGSEMLVAADLGFARVVGVEVDPFLVSVCERRVLGLGRIEPALYDGRILPFPDRSVDVVASGHIVEHTGDPALYLAECLRVLAPNGYLSLEFPTRFHWTELHTGLPSLEWLPTPLRNAGLRALSGSRSPLSAGNRRKYESILGTELKQISFGMVGRTIRRSGQPARILHKAVPAPGVVRCVVQKG